MSDHAGILCNAANVKTSARRAAHAPERVDPTAGLAFDGAYEAARALQWQQTALVSEAVLTALAFYIERGGGSRGARAICVAAGRSHACRLGLVPLEEFRFVSERAEDRAEQILIRFEAGNVRSARRGRFAVATATTRRSSSATGPIS